MYTLCGFSIRQYWVDIELNYSILTSTRAKLQQSDIQTKSTALSILLHFHSVHGSKYNLILFHVIAVLC